MATRKEKGEQGEKIKVDDMEVNVKTPPPSKVRPVYNVKYAMPHFQVN
jgi:hypothetical protein